MSENPPELLFGMKVRASRAVPSGARGDSIVLDVRRVASLPPPDHFTFLRQSVRGERVWWRRQGGRGCLLWENRALLEVRPGGAVTIASLRPPPMLSPEMVNLAVALCLARRGFQVLHAGALAQEGSCAVVLGPPGAGKSSLILAGARRGMQVVADEIVPFRARRGDLMCPGSHPVIRIAPMLLSPAERAASRTGSSGKIAARVSTLGLKPSETPVRLSVLVFLGPRLRGGRSRRAFRVEPITPAAALIGLLDNSYNRRVLATGERRRHLRACSRAARLLPAYRLSVRHGIRHIAAAARGLDALLARHSSGPGARRSGRRSALCSGAGGVTGSPAASIQA